MTDILTEFLEAGFSIRLDGNQLIVTPASLLTATQRTFLKANKAQILKLLSPKRPIVNFKLHHNQGGGSCLGDFGDSPNEIIAELQLRYGDRLRSVQNVEKS